MILTTNQHIYIWSLLPSDLSYIDEIFYAKDIVYNRFGGLLRMDGSGAVHIDFIEPKYETTFRILTSDV